jgi:hypothetical protein
MPRPTCGGSLGQRRRQCADGQTPRALLRVHLHKMKGPKQVLRAATLWEEGVPLEQLTYFFDNKHARPEKLPEVLCLRRCRADTVRRPVLYVPGQCLKVRHGHVARGILLVVVVGHLAGGHGHRLWRRRRRWGGGREGVGNGCVLCGVMWPARALSYLLPGQPKNLPCQLKLPSGHLCNK